MGGGAPACLIALLMACPLWLERLSITTTSFGASGGRRKRSISIRNHAATGEMPLASSMDRSRRKLVAKITQWPITAEAVLVCNIAHRHHLNKGSVHIIGRITGTLWPTLMGSHHRPHGDPWCEDALLRRGRKPRRNT